MTETSIYIIVGCVYALVLGSDIVKLLRLLNTPTIKFDIEKYFLRINLIVFLFGLILFLTLTLFEINFLKYSPPIEYANHEIITLDDFDGFNFPTQTLQGSSRFAFITTSIDFDLDKDKVEVKSYFHPSRSYVYIDDLEDDNLLKHEMYHFHITEIWAREFRKVLSELKNRPSGKKLQVIYDDIMDREASMQKQYDYETDHSYLLGKQMFWEKRVDSLLLSLKDFEYTKLIFD